MTLLEFRAAAIHSPGERCVGKLRTILLPANTLPALG